MQSNIKGFFGYPVARVSTDKQELEQQKQEMK